jgi:hypothetical protein
MSTSPGSYSLLKDHDDNTFVFERTCKRWQPNPASSKPCRTEYDLTLSRNLFIEPAPIFYRTSFSSLSLMLLLLCFITLAHTLDLHYKTLQPPRLIGNPGQRRIPLPDQVLFSVLPPPSTSNSGGIVICRVCVYASANKACMSFRQCCLEELAKPGGGPLRHAPPSPCIGTKRMKLAAMTIKPSPADRLSHGERSKSKPQLRSSIPYQVGF